MATVPAARPVALVTGASGGIGLELARLAAKDGHDVILVARSADKLEEAAKYLRGMYGVRTEVIVADLADPEPAPRRCRSDHAGAARAARQRRARARRSRSGSIARSTFPGRRARRMVRFHPRRHPDPAEGLNCRMRRVLPILLLLLAGAVALWLWPATDRLPAQGAPAGASAAVDDAAARPASALAEDSPERPNEASYTPPPANPALVALEQTLPPISTPLAQAREAWWSAARQGSGEAAWRLVVASETCAQYPMVRKLGLRQRGDPQKPERVAMGGADDPY